jgi:FkbM family methyltransferase
VYARDYRAAFGFAPGFQRKRAIGEERETATEAAILATVREGSVVYDVGAHIGSVTLGTARLAGATGRVVAFEADPDTVSSLRESCYLNDFEQRVEIIHAAVWSRSERGGILFRRGVSRPSHGGVVADGCQPVLADGPTITVPSTTLDEFVAQHGSTPELIKIDVEGAEYEVLRGGEILFGRDRPLSSLRSTMRTHWKRSTNGSNDFAILPNGMCRSRASRGCSLGDQQSCRAACEAAADYVRLRWRNHQAKLINFRLSSERFRLLLNAERWPTGPNVPWIDP